MKELIGSVVGETQLGRRRSVPVLYLQGSHYEVGFDVGRTFGAVINDYVASNEDLRQFEREYKTETGRNAYDLTLTNMKQRYPYYVKELQGVADGAGVSFVQLFLLQMDDIIGTINDNQIPRNDTGGCSSVGLNNPGHFVLGHTEDALSVALNHFYIMSVHIIPTPEDAAQGAVEERFASLCYAGSLPGYTSGFNEHGLVFSINTLSPAQLKPGNTPRTFITRALLTAKSYHEAERILKDEGLGIANGFSVNMLWTHADGTRHLTNTEVAPNLQADNSLVNSHKYDKDPLIHVNIYQRIRLREVHGPIVDSSKNRLAAIQCHPPPKTREDIEDILSDTSGKKFQVFENRSDAVIKTICAGIFDLDEKTWNIYINQPNASEPVAILPIRFKFDTN